MAAFPAARGSGRRTCRARSLCGGIVALVDEGDSITIDAHKQLLQLNVRDDEIARRRAVWRPPPRYTRGLLAKYMRLVSTASKGAITDGGDP